MKKFLSVLICALLIVAVFAGCGSSSSKDSPEPIEYDVQGTGDLSDKNLTVYFFGEAVEIGQIKVNELLSQGWGKDPESWNDVNLEQQMEYKDYILGKEIDKKGIEAKIDFKNLTDTFTTPEKCVVTSIRVSGFQSIQAANVTTLNNVTIPGTIEEFEALLKANVSSYNYHSQEYTYSTSKIYTVTLPNGTIVYDFSIDNETNAIDDLTIESSVNTDYVIQ